MNWIGRIGDGNRDGDDGDVTNGNLPYTLPYGCNEKLS